MSENTPQAVPGVVIPEDTRPEESMDSAGRRWWNDPVFHAQASVAVNVATAGQPDDGFDRWHRDSLIAGVTIALHLVSTGVITPEPSGMDWRPPASDPEF